MSQSPPPASAPQSGRWRFRTVMLLVVLVILAGLWWTRSLSYFCNLRVAQALRRDHQDDAWGWVTWSEGLRDGNPETHFWKCRILRKMGRIEESAAELRKYQDGGGDRVRAQREKTLAQASMGEASKLLGELADMLVHQEGDADEVCSSFVNGFLRSTEYEQAFVVIEQWKQSYPQDPRPHYANGKVQDHLSNWPAAEREYRDALAKQPDHYPSAYSLARLLLSNNHPAEALPLFTLCSQMKYNAAALIGMAKCLRQMGDNAAARKQLLQAIAQTPENRALSFHRLHEREEGNTAEVELGNLELAAGNYQAALEHLDIAHKANPRDLEVRYSRAVAMRQTGAKKAGAQELAATNAARQALAEADRIVDTIDPLKPEVPARLQIGEVYLKHGSLRTARFWIESALSHDPGNDQGQRLLDELNTTEKSLVPSNPSATTP